MISVRNTWICCPASDESPPEPMANSIRIVPESDNLRIAARYDFIDCITYIFLDMSVYEIFCILYYIIITVLLCVVI